MVEIHVQSSFLPVYRKTHEFRHLDLNKYVYDKSGSENGLSVLFNEYVI
jgi:hypothetical protein